MGVHVASSQFGLKNGICEKCTSQFSASFKCEKHTGREILKVRNAPWGLSPEPNLKTASQFVMKQFTGTWAAAVAAAHQPDPRKISVLPNRSGVTPAMVPEDT